MYQASGMTQQVRDIEVGMESESEGHLKLPAITQQRSITPKNRHRERQVQAPATTSLTPASQPGLIIVRYGANQRAVLNSFCISLHLLNFLKRISGCRAMDSVDLVNWHSGEVQNVTQHVFDYAYKHLSARETYLLVKIETAADAANRLPVYMSMLDSLTDINPTLAARLDALSKPAKSQKLKNKWSSLSKKSMDGDAEKPERKTGLLAIISGKEGIAPTLSVTDSTSDKRQADLERNDRPSASLVVSRFNKLPPIGR